MNRFDISCFHLLAVVTCVLVPVSFLTAQEPPSSSDIAKASGISGDHIDGVTPQYSTFSPGDKASQTQDGEGVRDEGQQTDRKERITELRHELEEARTDMVAALARVEELVCPYNLSPRLAS